MKPFSILTLRVGDKFKLSIRSSSFLYVRKKTPFKLVCHPVFPNGNVNYAKRVYISLMRIGPIYKFARY